MEETKKTEPRIEYICQKGMRMYAQKNPKKYSHWLPRTRDNPGIYQ
jgi:hypothetical protein